MSLSLAIENVNVVCLQSVFPKEWDEKMEENRRGVPGQGDRNFLLHTNIFVPVFNAAEARALIGIWNNKWALNIVIEKSKFLQ
jgi:hypothetical protein